MTVTETGFDPFRTLRFRVELIRQLRRRRTQATLAFMVALPVIILLAFEIGGGGGDGDGGGPGSAAFGSIVDVATAGGLNFALFTLFVSSAFLIVVVVALFHGDTVAAEAGWGSLRYLLAIPVPRLRLLAVKLAVAATLSIVAVATLLSTALLLGTVRYGWEPMQLSVAAEVAPMEGLVRLAGMASYILTVLLFVASLAFLFSVLTDAPLGAVGGAVLIYILSSILDQITALGDLRVFLPTHYNQAYLGLLSSPIQWEAMFKGAFSALLWGSLLVTWAMVVFRRSDITS
jgi:ABC-2 type transport system permease protein